MRPRTVSVPVVGLVMPATSFEQRALAGTVAADDAQGSPRRHRERHVADRRERLVRLQIADQAARQQRALERRELAPAAVAAVDLRHVGDFDGVHH